MSHNGQSLTRLAWWSTSTQAKVPSVQTCEPAEPSAERALESLF